MKDNSLTVTIEKPLEEVFEFCVTPPKAKLWVPGIINETTNEWPVKVGTVYTEYKDNNTSFNLIVADCKENDYIEWETEDGNYQVKYSFKQVSPTSTQLNYVETGSVEKPFTQEILEKLKQVIENT